MKNNLCQTNPYLRDPKKLREMLVRNTYESSVFEGARGLKRSSYYLLKAESMASRKKSVKSK